MKKELASDDLATTGGILRKMWRWCCWEMRETGSGGDGCCK